jgi:membrane-associated phospholipid phosphatase
MRQFKFNTILLILFWVVLAVIFGMYDLEISKQLVNENSGWAKFLENYGMIPGLLVILSGIYIYCSFIKIKSGVWSYVQRIVLFLVSSGLIFYLMEILLDKLMLENFITSLIIAFALNLIIFIVLQIRKQVKSTIAIQYAKVVIGMAFFGYVICIQVVKYLWGRVRFRELDAAFSQFTPWYLPQGITGFDSFPSGHAATGFMLLSLLILLHNKKQWIKYSALLLIILWGTVLSLSRVVIGAHYASDVLFGSFFIIFAFIILQKNSKSQASINK